MAIKVKRIKSGIFGVGTTDVKTDKTLVDQQLGFETASGNLKICTVKSSSDDTLQIIDAIKNIEGNAKTATQLATSRTIQTNLASSSAASFNGTANVSPGVAGTLPVTNGGTGQSAALTTANRTFLARKSINQGSTSSGNVGFRAIEAADLPDLDASKITNGTLDVARIPTLNQNTTGSSGSCTGNAATATNATNHIAKTDNPHSVTKAQVGLSNVDNVKQYSASNPPPLASSNGQTAGTAKFRLSGTTLYIRTDGTNA